MRDLKHLIYFEDLLQDANNALVQKASADGRLALAYNCSYIPELLLDVEGDNLPTIRLYERLGFAPTGRRQEFQDFCGHVALREYALAL